MSVHSKIDDKGREKVKCKECGEYHHRLDVHLKKHGMKAAEYKAKYPGSLTISAAASEKAAEAARKSMEKRMGKSLAVTVAKKAAKVAKSKPASESGEGEAFKIGVARLFQRADLLADEQELVPVHDPLWMPGKRALEEWELIAVAVQDNTPVYLHGDTGCGKSTGVLELASALNQPCRRVQMSQQFKEATMIGKTELVIDDHGNQITKWVDGLLPEAMRRGWWLVIDEFTATPPGILFALQAVLEGAPLMLPSGEVVKPHKNFRIAATDNTNGLGDDSGRFAGTHVMNDATMDRFGVVIACDYPEADQEAKIIVAKGRVDPKVAEKMVRVANKVREARRNEVCFCSFSLRRLISWSKMTTRFGGDARKASKSAILSKLSAEDSEFVNGLIQRYFGGDV